MTTWIARILFWVLSLVFAYVTAWFIGAFVALIVDAFVKGYDAARWFVF